MSNVCRWIGLVGVTGVVGVAEAGPPASEWIPPSVDAAIVLDDPGQAFQGVRRFANHHDLMGGPIGDAIRANPELMQGWLFLNGVAAVAGTDAWTAIERILGDDACIGFMIEPGVDPTFLLATVTTDAPERARVVDGLFRAVGLSPDHPARTHAGARVFRLGDDLEIGRTDDVLIISNRSSLLNDAIDGGKDLTDATWFQTGEQNAPDNALAWMTVDPGLRDRIPPEAMVPAHAEEAFAGMLLGGWQGVLTDLAGAFASVRTDGEDLVASLDLTALMPIEASRSGFLPEPDRTRRWSGEQIAGYIGEVDVRRLWDNLVADRESYMTLPASAQVVDFTTGVSNVMGGLDFVEDVLAQIDGPVRLIAADRSFDGASVRPVPSLPSFALIADLELPEGSDLPLRLYSAGQIALSIISMDQAQKAQTGLLMDMDRHNGHRLVYGRYPLPAGATPDAPAQTGVAHNFEPGLAMVDGALIIASSREMLEATIDAAANAGEATVAMGDIVDHAHVKADTLASALQRNREMLVVGRMLDEGRTRAQAELEMDALFTGLRMLESIRLETRQHPQGSSAEFRLSPVWFRD